MVENMENIKFKHYVDENNNIMAHIDDLIPNEINEMIYGNENAENSKVNEIADDMKLRISQGLIPNSKPIPVNRIGNMKGGHTRRKALYKTNERYIHIHLISDKEWKKVEGKPYDETRMLLSDNLLSRKKVYSVVLGEYNALENNFFKQHNQQPEKEDMQLWVKELQSGFPHKLSLTCIKQLKIIKTRDPLLLKDIDEGKTTPNKAYKMVKNFKPKNLPRTNRNLISIFKDETNVKRWKNLYRQIRHNFMTKNTFTHEDGEVVNWITDTYVGPEINYMSNSFSQMVQSVNTSFFRKYYPEMDARSPRHEQGAPDTQFHAYNQQGVDPYRLEAKVTDSHNQIFYFGLGGSAINPHEFLLMIRQGTDRFCAFITTLTNDGKLKDIKTQGQGSVMSVETWFKNHFDKEDWHCFHGDIRRGQNGKIEINYEEFGEEVDKN